MTGTSTTSRDVITAALLLLVAALGAGCAPGSPVHDGSGPSAGEVRVYEVFGMDCPGCHGGLEDLAERVSGVAAARADWKAKSLTLTLIPGADPGDDEVRAAIEKANFTPGERLQ